MLRFLRGAWWALRHPSDAMLVALVALLLLLAPELAILIVLVAWQTGARRRPRPRVIHGAGFTMREADGDSLV